MISAKESSGALLALILLISGLCSRLAHCQLLVDDDDQQPAGDRYRYEMADAPGQQYSGLSEDVLGGLLSERPNEETHGDSLLTIEDEGKLIDQLAAELLEARREEQRRQQEPLFLEVEESEPELEEPDERRLELGAASQQQQKRQTPGGFNHYYEINSHLPATSPLASAAGEPPKGAGSWISPPVNDPDEFEAKLGQLTDALNNNMANTRERQELLLGLLNRSRDEEAPGRDPVNSLNSISQPEIDRLVGQLDRWLEEQTSESQHGPHQQHQRQQQRQDQEQQRRQQDDADQLARYGASEYIDHPLALVGHQFVQGGAGEGCQLLGPDGTYQNVQVVKTDSAIPSYCDPPNPCPLGYTVKDGCLENFINSASFSREYQAEQKCSCDNEHSLFNCAAPISSMSAAATAAASSQQSRQESSSTSAATDDGQQEDGDDENDNNTINTGNSNETSPELGGKLETLARTIQNRFGDLAAVQRLIGKQQQRQQRQKQQNPILAAGEDNSNPNNLVRSARKLSAIDIQHSSYLD